MRPLKCLQQQSQSSAANLPPSPPPTLPPTHHAIMPLSALLLAALAALAAGHGMLISPRVRGAENCHRAIPNARLPGSDKLPIDYCPHCGNAGGVNAVRDAGPSAWRLYSPLTDNRGGFGMCGDAVGNNDHMKFGKFGSAGASTTWTEGDTVTLEFDATANHGGFLEYYLCDVGNNEHKDVDIHTFGRDCRYLERAWEGHCESGNDKTCGPIDKAFPGRFMLGCRWREGDQGDQIFKMKYKLPEGFHSDNAVIQMYWFVSNSCQSPDGFTEGYKYPHSWGSCKGDGGSIGGKPQHHQTCAEQGKFPEEFWNCADVIVKPKHGGGAHAYTGEGGTSNAQGGGHSANGGGGGGGHVVEDGNCARSGGQCTPGRTRCCHPDDYCGNRNGGGNKCVRGNGSNKGHCRQPGEQSETWDQCCVEGRTPQMQDGVHRC